MTAYRRRRGERVTYTPEQTAHYRSLRLRWRKGRGTFPAKIESVIEDGERVTKLYYNALRSASGYWIVTVKAKPPEEPPEDPPPGGGMGYPCQPYADDVVQVRFLASVLITYAASESFSGMSYSDSNTSSGSFTTGWYDLNPGDSIVTIPESTSGSSIETGISGLSYGGSYTTTTDAVYLYHADLGTYEPIDYRASSYISSFVAIVSTGDGTAALSIERTWTANLIPQFRTLDGIPLPNTCPINNPPPPDPDPEEEEDDLTFTCTCPDVNKVQASLLNGVYPSPYPSEHGDRNWVGSGAGVELCKHIYSAMFLFGLEPEDPGGPDSPPRRQRPGQRIIRFEFSDPAPEPERDNFDPYQWRRERQAQRRRERTDRESDFANTQRMRQLERDRQFQQREQYLLERYSGYVLGGENPFETVEEQSAFEQRNFRPQNRRSRGSR